MRRMVSVVCPSFALWAQRRRTDPADPLVLTVEQRNLVLVHDASPAARAAGAAPGQPLTARTGSGPDDLDDDGRSTDSSDGRREPEARASQRHDETEWEAF